MWGHKEHACIIAIQNRAMRYYLGVGRYTPTAAGLDPPHIRQWKVIANFWSRMSCTTDARLNKRISLWASSKTDHYKNRYFWVKKHLTNFDLTEFHSISNPIAKSSFIKRLHDCMFEKFVIGWKDKINAAVEAVIN